MTIIDVESLLTAVSDDLPEGQNLEYDPAYVDLDRLAAKKSEKAIDDPDAEPESTDWKAIKKSSIELLLRSKDLRIAVLLTRALINTDGFPGLEDGLSLIIGMLNKYWDSLHPELDADDDNDPIMRMNALVSLCDREAVIEPILLAPLVTVKGWGSYSLQDIHTAGGMPSGEESEIAGESLETIKAAFMESPIEDLKATAAAVVAARSHLTSIDAFVMEKVDSSIAPNLDSLARVLGEVANEVNGYLELRGEVAESVNEEGGTGSGHQAPQQISGEINSRESATKMMDKISEYFRKNEPSSPVPLLMQRAKRVSNMGFMEIIRDIAPNGLEQAQNIGGTDSDT